MTHDAPIRCLGCFGPSPSGERCDECGWTPGAEQKQIVEGQLPLGVTLAGRYVIGRPLGRGGFSITYLAWDAHFERRRAIKEYFPTGVVTRDSTRSDISIVVGQGELFSEGRKKYVAEARLLARFEGNPCIVYPLDFFEANGTAYLVMEHLEGETLRSYVTRRGGRIPYEHALYYLRPVARALETVHEAGVLHRDVSPDNVFLTVQGESKLLDFGAARTAQPSTERTVILHDCYAPPEQYSKTGAQGRWTDIYGLAATLYFTLTGDPPPSALERVARDELQRPSALGATLPSRAERALLQALALEPRERPGCVEDLLAELEPPATRDAGSHAPGAGEALRRIGARLRDVPGGAPIAAGAGIGAALLVAAAALLWQTGAGPGEAQPGSDVSAAVDSTAPPEPDPGPRLPPAGDPPSAGDGSLSSQRDSVDPPVAPRAPTVASLAAVIRSFGPPPPADWQPESEPEPELQREPEPGPIDRGPQPAEPGPGSRPPRAPETPAATPPPPELPARNARDRLARAREQLANEEPSDRMLGLEAVRALAEQGNPAAQEALGALFVVGVPGVLDPDDAKALYWTGAAADSGRVNAGYTLARRLELGRWERAPEPQPGLRCRLLGLACPQDDAPPPVDPQQDFPAWLRSQSPGAGSPEELSEAYRLYERLAENGHAPSQRRRGFMLYAGHGVNPNFPESFLWLREAALQDDALAQFAIGKFHETGEAYPNREWGLCWLRKAATERPEARRALEAQGVPIGESPRRCPIDRAEQPTR